MATAHPQEPKIRRSRLGIGWRLLRFVKWTAAAYLTIILLLMLFENYLIFPGPKCPDGGDWQPSFPPCEDVFFESADGTRLHGWYVEHPEPKAYVMFFHGNAENVAGSSELLAWYRVQLHATVFAFDYRGYGRSAGSASERGVLADARAAHSWFVQRTGIQPDDVILIGRSVGGAVAVDLAAERGARALVVERSFTSLPDVAARHFPWAPVRWLMRTKLDSLSKIAHYRGPLLQSHGTHDEIVPFELGERLFHAAPSPKKQFFREPGGHNDPYSDEYLDALRDFIEELPPTQ